MLRLRLLEVGDKNVRLDLDFVKLDQLVDAEISLDLLWADHAVALGNVFTYTDLLIFVQLINFFVIDPEDWSPSSQNFGVQETVFLLVNFIFATNTLFWEEFSGFYDAFWDPWNTWDLLLFLIFGSFEFIYLFVKSLEHKIIDKLNLALRYNHDGLLKISKN